MKKFLISALVAVTLSTLSVANAATLPEGWEEIDSGDQNVSMFGNKDLNTVVTAAVSPTNGKSIKTIAKTVAKQLTCSEPEQDEDDNDTFTINCEDSNNAIIITKIDDREFVTVSVTAKSEQGFTAADKFIEEILFSDN